MFFAYIYWWLLKHDFIIVEYFYGDTNYVFVLVVNTYIIWRLKCYKYENKYMYLGDHTIATSCTHVVSTQIIHILFGSARSRNHQTIVRHGECRKGYPAGNERIHRPAHSGCAHCTRVAAAGFAGLCRGLRQLHRRRGSAGGCRRQGQLNTTLSHFVFVLELWNLNLNLQPFEFPPQFCSNFCFFVIINWPETD